VRKANKCQKKLELVLPKGALERLGSVESLEQIVEAKAEIVRR